MFTEERLEHIVQLLHQNGRVKVKELSERFNVKEDCIRKDLKVLENGGKLKRTYGGAICSQDYPLQRDVIDRRMVHVSEKQIIAQKAAQLIKENETIFLDISTTNIKIAELLVASGKRITAVSNMLDILQVLARGNAITTIGTGGTMHRTVNGFMGIATADVIKQYSFDKSFIGSCGIDMVDASITTFGVEDGLTKKAAILSSRHKYIVMEHTKFYYNDSYKFAHVDDIDGIITDLVPDIETQKVLEASNVKLY